MRSPFPPTAESGKVGVRVRLKVPLRPKRLQRRDRITPHIQGLGDPKAGVTCRWGPCVLLTPPPPQDI